MIVTKLTVNQTPGIPKKERAKIRAAVHRVELLFAQQHQLDDLNSIYASVLRKVNNLARFHPGEAAPLKARLISLLKN